MKVLGYGLALCIVLAILQAAFALLIGTYLSLWVIAIIVRPKESIAFLTVFAFVGILKPQGLGTLIICVFLVAAVISLGRLLAATVRQLD